MATPRRALTMSPRALCGPRRARALCEDHERRAECRQPTRAPPALRVGRPRRDPLVAAGEVEAERQSNRDRVETTTGQDGRLVRMTTIRRAAAALSAALFVVAAGVPAVALATTPTAPATPALTGIRTGAHPGFDRIVLDLSAGSTPTVTQRRVDELVADPSGQVEWLTGVTFTEVVVHGAHNQGSYPGPAKFRTRNLDNVVAVAITGDFEDVLSIGVGERRATAVHVSTLTAPNRVVIDVDR